MAALTYNIQSIPSAGADFYVSYESTDLSSGADIIAAVAGSTHFITQIDVRTATAMNIDIGSGASGTVTTRHIGLIAVNAASGFFPWRAPKGMGMKCTVSTALTIDASASGQIWIEVRGRTCKV